MRTRQGRVAPLDRGHSWFAYLSTSIHWRGAPRFGVRVPGGSCPRRSGAASEQTVSDSGPDHGRRATSGPTARQNPPNPDITLGQQDIMGNGAAVGDSHRSRVGLTWGTVRSGDVYRPGAGEIDLLRPRLSREPRDGHDAAAGRLGTRPRELRQDPFSTSRLSRAGGQRPWPTAGAHGRLTTNRSTTSSRAWQTAGPEFAEAA